MKTKAIITLIISLFLLINLFGEENSAEEAEELSKDEGINKYYELASESLWAGAKFSTAKFNPVQYELEESKEGLSSTQAGNINETTSETVFTEEALEAQSEAELAGEELSDELLKNVMNFLTTVTFDTATVEGAGDIASNILGLCMAADSVETLQSVADIAFAIFSFVMLENIDWFQPDDKKISFPINTIFQNKSKYKFLTYSYNVLPNKSNKAGKRSLSIINPDKSHLYSYIVNYDGHDNSHVEQATITPSQIPYFIRPIVNNVALPMSIMYTGTYYTAFELPQLYENNGDMAFPLYGGLPTSEHQINFFSSSFETLNDQQKSIENNTSAWYNSHPNQYTISTYSDKTKVIKNGSIQYDLNLDKLPDITMWKISLDLSKIETMFTGLPGGPGSDGSWPTIQYNLYLYTEGMIPADPYAENNQYFLFSDVATTLQNQPSPSKVALNILPPNKFTSLTRREATKSNYFAYQPINNSPCPAFYLGLVNGGASNADAIPGGAALILRIDKLNYSATNGNESNLPQRIAQQYYIIPLNFVWDSGTFGLFGAGLKLEGKDVTPICTSLTGTNSSSFQLRNVSPSYQGGLYNNLSYLLSQEFAAANFQSVTPYYKISITPNNISGINFTSYKSTTSNSYEMKISVEPTEEKFNFQDIPDDWNNDNLIPYIAPAAVKYDWKTNPLNLPDPNQAAVLGSSDPINNTSTDTEASQKSTEGDL